MIDVKELRIGNWVTPDNAPFPCRVEIIFTNKKLKTSIGINSVETSLCKYEEKRLMPIELDKKILDKIFPFDYDFDPEHREQRLIESWIVKYKIKYVHSLQNLVFALLGKELKFDLEVYEDVLEEEDENEE